MATEIGKSIFKVLLRMDLNALMKKSLALYTKAGMESAIAIMVNHLAISGLTVLKFSSKYSGKLSNMIFPKQNPAIPNFNTNCLLLDFGVSVLDMERSGAYPNLCSSATQLDNLISSFRYVILISFLKKSTLESVIRGSILFRFFEQPYTRTTVHVREMEFYYFEVFILKQAEFLKGCFRI